MAGSIHHGWFFGRLSAAITLTTALILSAAGCGPAGRLSMVQPHLTGWQNEVRLKTENVKWTRSEGVDRVLAEFPLPGARTGRPTYLLYLRAPSGVKKINMDATADARMQGRGFMIQTRGEYAGLARISGGTLRMHGPSLLNVRIQRIEVDVICEDGTKLTGDLTATRDDYLLPRFETKQRPADVQALLKATTNVPATKPQP